MLGRLQRDNDTITLAELPSPHARAVHDVLALDIAALRADANNSPGLGEHLADSDALKDADALHACALGQRHRCVDGVDPTVSRDVEPGQQIGRVGKREPFGDLRWADLVDIEPDVAVEGRHSPVLLQPTRIRGGLNEAHRLEPGRQASLRLKPLVELAGVLTHRHRRLGHRPEAGHQSGRMPGRARREPIAFEEHHIGPAQMAQVVRDRRSDDATADDDDACAGGKVAHGSSA